MSCYCLQLGKELKVSRNWLCSVRFASDFAHPTSNIARLKHLLTGASGRVDRRSQTKLIKEDHFACTTKMSEFFKVHSGICVSRSWSKPGSRPDRSSTLDPLDTHPRGHSDYSLVKEHRCRPGPKARKGTLIITLQTLKGSFASRFHLNFSRWGRGIISSRAVLSTAVAKILTACRICCWCC